MGILICEICYHENPPVMEENKCLGCGVSLTVVHPEYARGVNTMSLNLYRPSGSIYEVIRNEEHNDSVFTARAKSLSNADGKLNMTLGQSELYVELIRSRAREEALEEAAREVEALFQSSQHLRYKQWNEAVKESSAAIRALKLTSE